MPTKSENKSNKLIQKLDDSKSLLDVLIQIEDFMDSKDLYCFKNWFDGEIIDGPNIKKYWVSITLKYAYKDMPDPDGGLRLIKHGAKITYTKDYEEEPTPLLSPADFRPGTKKPKMKKEPIWLVEIKIPRRFIEELSNSDLELYTDEVDVDDTEDSTDADVNDDSNEMNDEQNPDTENETGDIGGGDDGMDDLFGGE